MALSSSFPFCLHGPPILPSSFETETYGHVFFTFSSLTHSLDYFAPKSGHVSIFQLVQFRKITGLLFYTYYVQIKKYSANSTWYASCPIYFCCYLYLLFFFNLSYMIYILDEHISTSRSEEANILLADTKTPEETISASESLNSSSSSYKQPATCKTTDPTVAPTGTIFFLSLLNMIIYWEKLPQVFLVFFSLQ